MSYNVFGGTLSLTQSINHLGTWQQLSNKAVKETVVLCFNACITDGAGGVHGDVISDDISSVSANASQQDH